jgi:type I restriction enzyme S subunit
MKQETIFVETEIGELPEEWEIKKIGELFEIFVGGDAKKLNVSKTKSKEYKYPIYSNSLRDRGLYGFSNEYKHPPNCITITSRGEVGIAEYRDEFFNAIVRLLVLKPKTEVSSYFMSYFINSKLDFQIVGSAVNQLTAPMISDFLVAYPPLPEQKAITKILSDLDSKIELLQEQNKTLENIGKTIFKQWFVDFEFPNEEGKPYKSSGGKMIESEFGEIPEGWKINTIDSEAKIVTRGFTTKYVEKSNLINLNQKVNRGNYLDKSNYKYYSEETDIPKDKYAAKGDLLVNSLGQGTLGRIHLYWDNTNNVVVDQHITIIRMGDNKLNPVYLYYYLTEKSNHDRLMNSITGSTGMLMLNVSKIREFSIVVPGNIILDKFYSLTKILYEKISKNNNELENIIKIRDSLLPKLMTGKIRVPVEVSSND